MTRSQFAYVDRALLALKGVVPPLSPIDLGKPTASISIRLVPPDDDALSIFDRTGALAVMAMTGGALEHHPNYAERFAKAAGDVREERHRLHKGSALLWVEKRGTLRDFAPSAIGHSQSYSVCFDDLTDPSIRLGDQELAWIVGAVTVSCPQLIGVTRSSRALTIERTDGALIHCYQLQMGTGSMYVSLPIGDEDRKHIVARYRSLAGDPALTRVTRLLKLSFETDGDRLRAFLASWNALEIFIGKSYDHYRRVDVTPRWRRLVNRFIPRWAQRPGVRSTPPIADRFEILARALDAKGAKTDVSVFRLVKKHRDRLAHGQDVDESALPVQETRGLFRKYIALHVDARAATA
jgi:hypothetical protein